VGFRLIAILKTKRLRGRRAVDAVPELRKGGAMMNTRDNGPLDTHRLRHNGKLTQRYYALENAHSAEGASAEGEHRTRAIDVYRVLEGLRRDGLVEIRRTGPRGGKRYHATDAGIDALVDLET